MSHTVNLDFAQYLAIQQLYADYASAVDAGDWDRWVEMFTDECTYRLQPRENHERGFPLATMFFESKGALKDRAYAIQETLFHDPYYQRHVLGAPLVRWRRSRRSLTRSGHAWPPRRPTLLASRACARRSRLLRMPRPNQRRTLTR